jgi:lipid-binding SYLF domain-containing protein
MKWSSNMRKNLILVMALGCGLSTRLMANGPAETVVEAEHVLSELMAIPAKQIPHRLLSEAQGIVIVPNVIKIGFVAGARRGHGVVMVRDPDGEWSLPQFVMLTGGSVGFQAGIQGTDVVLVFTTRKGVEGLMRGKFTVGVDAAATAGPVGREAAAGTDATLQSEIYSYSRSRGLFVGVSLDGSALEIDHESHAFYYGTPSGQLPRRVPTAAADLRHFLAELTARPTATPVTTDHVAPAISPRLLEGLRRALLQSNAQLQSMLDTEWRRYLALPAEIQQQGSYPSPEAVKMTLVRFAQVSKGAEYQHLARHPEFQRTYELLSEFEKALVSTRPALTLPPPPTLTR